MRRSQYDTRVEERSLSTGVAKKDPDWLMERRIQGVKTFRERGMPSSRYFSFERYPAADLPAPSVPEKPPTLFPDHTLMVFVDQTGFPAPSLPQGVVVQSFSEFVLTAQAQDLLMNRIVPATEDGLTALHASLVRDGAFVTVQKGVVLSEPVRIQFRYRSGGCAFVTHTFIHLKEGARLNLVEEFTADDPARLPSEPVYHSHIVEALLEPFSVLQYGALEDAPPMVYLGRRRAARIGREARISWAISWMGAQMTHSGTRTELIGEAATAEDIQVFFGIQSQQLDLHSTMNHRAPHTRAEVLVKGVLRDRARSVFNGMLRILPEGNTSDSYQQSHTLLLNPGARADAIPGLEILANDVRCTHSATTGPIDEDQLFYIRSRGIAEDFAKKLIVEGFLEPVFARIPIGAVREAIRHSLNKKWFSR